MNESQQTPIPAAYGDEIGLRELFRVLWAGKWLIGGVSIGATIIAIIVALMLPNIYRAEALLAPNADENVGGLSALASQYGGLATLAGVNLGDGFNDKTAVGLEILRSRRFISEFVERHDILVPLMASKRWDSETGVLKIESNDYDQTAKKWIRDVSPPKKATPSMQEAHEKLMDILSISQDKNTGFVTIAIEHYSPTIAKQWIDWLIADLNDTIMSQDVGEAEQAIEYLNGQISETSLSEVRQVFFDLVGEQHKTMMLADANKEYVFRTIDPALAPEQWHAPNRTLLVLSAMFLGLLIGCFTVVAFPPRMTDVSLD